MVVNDNHKQNYCTGDGTEKLCAMWFFQSLCEMLTFNAWGITARICNYR